MSKSKRYGLVLTTGGAPTTPHHIPEVPGYYRPDTPTLVGEEGDIMTLEQAKQYDTDDAIPLKLVEVDATQTEKIDEQNTDDVDQGIKAIKENVRNARDLEEAEIEILQDERAAAAQAKKAKTKRS